MKVYANIQEAIVGSKKRLETLGVRVPQKRWQSIKSPDDTWEKLNESFTCSIPDYTDLKHLIRPHLPWADEHFLERVSGTPFNPPPSHKIWPFAQKDNEQFISDEKFSHTYPERFWPKRAGDWLHEHKGIRYHYGDLMEVVRLIAGDPSTRQAYIPIFFPEDTGAMHGQRIPCTLGYHVIQRSNYLHMNYYMRSCDIVRHFRDDIYLAIKLLYWILERLQDTNKDWANVKPGIFTMHITSLHCFYNERGVLKQSNI